MKAVFRIAAILAIGVLAASAACAPSPALDITQSTTASSWTTTPVDTEIPIFKSTLTLTLEPTEIPSPSPTAIDPAPDIVLPGWVPEGARARLGRGKIKDAAMSPDGKRIAVAGAAGLSVFSSDTLDEIWGSPTLESVDRISYSSNGSLIYSMSFIVTNSLSGGFSIEVPGVLCWESESGHLLGSIPASGFGEMGIGASFSPDGSKVALSQGRDVQVWNLSTGTLIFSLRDDDLPGVNALDFSADGSTLAAGFYKYVVEWDLATGEKIWKKELPGKDPGLIALSPDRALIAIGTGRAVEVWDRQTEELLKILDISGSVSALSFSPDGKLLVVGDTTGDLVQWEPETGRSQYVRKGSGGTVNRIAFPNNGRNILAASEGGIVTWNADSGASGWMLENPYSRWGQIHFNPEDGEISAQAAGIVAFFNATDLTFRRRLEYPLDAVLSPDFSTYAQRTDEKKIVISSAENGKRLFSWNAPEYLRYFGDFSFFFSPNNRLAAIIHNDYTTVKAADIWNVSKGTLLRSLNYESYGSIESTILEFSASGRLVMLGIWDWEYGMAIAIFDPFTGNKISVFVSRSSYLAAVSPDDRMIATHCDGKPGVCVFDISGGKEIANFTIADEPVTVSSLSPDNRLFAVGFESGLVGLWDIETGELRFASRIHSGRISDLSFSPDGKTLASAGEDGTVILWNVEG